MQNYGKVWFCQGAEEWSGFPRWLSGKEFTCSARDAGLIPGWRRFPGGGNANPLQYSRLGNPMDRGAWWATVRGVSKESDTTWQLSNMPINQKTEKGSTVGQSNSSPIIMRRYSHVYIMR